MLAAQFQSTSANWNRCLGLCAMTSTRPPEGGDVAAAECEQKCQEQGRQPTWCQGQEACKSPCPTSAASLHFCSRPFGRALALRRALHRGMDGKEPDSSILPDCGLPVVLQGRPAELVWPVFPVHGLVQRRVLLRAPAAELVTGVAKAWEALQPSLVLLRNIPAKGTLSWS